MPLRLVEAGLDGFTETQCTPYYASRRGRPSLSPGRYFRMYLVGYFEGIDSERGLEWRCAGSLSLREFLRLGTTEPVLDHSWLSKTRAWLPVEVHEAVIAWALQRLAEHGLIKGDRIGTTRPRWRSTPPCGRSCGATRARATGRCSGVWRWRAGSPPRLKDLIRFDRQRRLAHLLDQAFGH